MNSMDSTANTLATGDSQSRAVPLSVLPAIALGGANPEIKDSTSSVSQSLEAVAGKRDAGDIFLTPTLVFSVSINSTDSPSTDLYVPTDIFEDYLSTHLLVSRLEGYAFLKGNLVITIVTTCPGSSFGAYCTAFIADGSIRPSGHSNAHYYDGVECDHQWTMTQGEFVINNCESQNTTEITLPFLFPGSALAINPAAPAGMWRMTTRPITPLQSSISTGNISGTLSVYVRLAPGYVLETRSYQGKKDAHVAQFASASAPKGSVSKITGSFGKAAAALADVPIIGGMAEAAATGLGMVTSALSMFGFTRESSPYNPPGDALKLGSNFATTDAPDISMPLALTTSNAVTIDPTVAGGHPEDCMSYATLFQRFSLVHTINITQNTASGTVLGNLPVTPMLCSFNPNVANGSGYLTVPGYVGLPFHRWSGALEFLIYIPSSTNFQGLLQVFWGPHTTSSFTSDPTLWQDGVLINLSGSSSTLIRVDMAPPFPSRDTSLVQPGTNQGLHPENSPNNGFLTFFLSQPLTSLRTTLSLSVHIYVRGTDTLDFHEPRQTLFGRPIGQAVGLAYQGTVVDPATSLTTVTLNRAEGVYPVSDVHFGEEIRSVRALVQKFSPYTDVNLLTAPTAYAPNLAYVPCPPRMADGAYTLAYPTLASFTDYFTSQGPVFPQQAGERFLFSKNIGSSAGNACNPWTWQAWYSALFTGVRGGTRFKIVSDMVSGKQVSLVSAGSANFWDVRSTLETIQLANDSWVFPAKNIPTMAHYDIQPTNDFTCSEVTVPYYCTSRYVCPSRRMIRYDWGGGVGNIETINPESFPASLMLSVPAVFASSNDTVRRVSLHVAAAPDFSGVYFRRTPKIAYSKLETVG